MFFDIEKNNTYEIINHYKLNMTTSATLPIFIWASVENCLRVKSFNSFRFQSMNAIERGENVI